MLILPKCCLYYLILKNHKLFRNFIHVPLSSDPLQIGSCSFKGILGIGSKPTPSPFLAKLINDTELPPMFVKRMGLPGSKC